MSKRRRVPTIQHGDQAAKDYVTAWFDENKNSTRKAAMVRMAWNLQMYLGNHWNAPTSVTKPGAGTYHFSPVYHNNDPSIPRPWDNMIGEGVKNLTDRITRKQYEPSTRANSRKPELEAAATMRRDILLHDQRKANWKAEIDRPVVTSTIICGPVFGRVLWDETLDSLMTVSATEAHKCAACGTTVSALSVDQQTLAKYSMTQGANLEMVKGRGQEDGGAFSLGACPKCEQVSENSLSPYSPSVEEAEAGAPDFFGRPLGEKRFKGEPTWEVPTPFEMYPQAGGYVAPRDCKIMGQATIRSMDWVEARVDPKICGMIDPDEPTELMKHHPTLGHQWFNPTSAGKSSDENTFNDCVRVFDLTVQPINTGGETAEDGLRWGRFIRVIKGHVVKNEPLMRDVPDTEDEEGKPKRVAISQYYVSGAIPVPGQVWFRTPVDDARGMNIRLNRLLAIQDDIAHRGVPIVVTPEGVELEAMRDTGGGAFKGFTFNGNAVPDWKPKDAIVSPNNGQAERLQPQIDDTRDRIRNQLGPMPIESGEAGGADSAIQAQLQAEQAAQKLNQIDEARVFVEEGMLQGYSDMIWAFRREGGEYEKENEAGEFEKESYDNTMLLGEAKVTLEAKGTVDESLLQAEKSAQAQQAGLYGDPSQWDQETIDDLLELRGLPKLNNVQSVQVKKAKAAWADFVREQKVPYIDVTINDTWIWYQVLGKLWQGDEAEKIQTAVGWDDVLRKLAGWERKLAASEAQDMAARAMYEGLPPESWLEVEAQFNDQAKGVAEAESKLAGAAGVPAMPPKVAPKPPQGGQFLPEALCDRLLMLWRAMLGTPASMDPMTGVQIPPQPLPDLYNDPEAKERIELEDGPLLQLDPVLRMYAVIQECRLEAEKKRMQPMEIAAPGGGATPSGGVPTPGAPVQPAVGVDQAVRGAA